MFLDLYFQLFLVIILMIAVIGHLVFNGFIKTYPELLDNGISIFKIVSSFFSKKDIIEKTLSHYDNINEKFEMLLEKLYWKSFYIIEIYLLFNIFIGYIIYNLDFYLTLNFFGEHSFLTNVGLLVCSYFLTKSIKRIKNV